jgi:hypothetical protein
MNFSMVRSLEIDGDERVPRIAVVAATSVD